MQTHRDIEFGDGVYRLQLRMAQIMAVEAKCGARIGAIYAHIMAGRYEKQGVRFGYGLEANFGYLEVKEVCFQALIGGGQGFVDGREIRVGDQLARHLVQTYIEPDAGNPLMRAWDLAEVILETALTGYEPAVTQAEKKSPKHSPVKRKAASTEGRSSVTAS